MLNDTNTLALSRRSFLVSTGAFSVAVAFGPALDTASAAAPFNPNAWVTIGEDNIVTIVAPMVEMGQGVRTSLPLILAEDLDADWNRVRISATPDNDQIYGNPIFNNQLTTVGSFSVTGYYEKLRLAGAQARKILIANAAAAWNVPADELTTEPGMVVHAKSNRKISYGDIAKNATVPDPLPEVTKADLKPSSQFRLIGRDAGRVDVPSKVNGTAQYGIDMQLPSMLYATVLFPQVQYEKAEQIDDAAAKAVKGVVKIVPLPSGVGVIAETIEAAMKAKDLLKVTWSKSTPAQAYDDDRVLQDYRAIAADWSQPGVEMVKTGDADEAVKGAATVLAADYFSDHVAHMCMEPLNVTVKAEDGTIDIWSGNQSPSTMKILGMIVGKTTPDKVHVHTQLLGGGFGRRSDGDDMVMALILALNVPGKPVKMIWNREDDIRNDKLRPLTAQRIEIGLDADNNIVGWRQRIVNESYFARILPPDLFAKIKQDVVSGGGGEMSYAVANHRVEWVRAARGVDVGAWRGIAAGYTKFAIETMVDEVAALKKMNPLAYRLEMLKGAPRAANVLQHVAAMANYATKRDGRAVGIAYSDALHSHTAVAAEVSVDTNTGEIKVHHLWAAVDPGTAVQPKNIVAQMTSAMTFGLGAALKEQIAIKGGVMQATNFDGYPVLRMSDIPPMDVAVVSTDDPPTGIGEAGVPAVAPAIANAVAQLTGKRLRHLPMTPERLKQSLG
ncbi:MAG: molybdopterin cofactor-binding domain-containing protein [Xanthobacteraceae bacterium]